MPLTLRRATVKDADSIAAVFSASFRLLQANARARRFYEARGFHAIRFTDGADNEERAPDVLYRGCELPANRRNGLGRESAEPHEPCGRSNPRGPYEM